MVRGGAVAPSIRPPAPHAGKSIAAHTLTVPPRLVPNSRNRRRGMHRLRQFERHGSRVAKSRRRIAALDFLLRGGAACSERRTDGRPHRPAANRLARSAYSTACRVG